MLGGSFILKEMKLSKEPDKSYWILESAQGLPSLSVVQYVCSTNIMTSLDTGEYVLTINQCGMSNNS